MFARFGALDGVGAGPVSPLGMVVIGVLVQLALMTAHALLPRLIADTESANQATQTAELIGDGITVLLFAAATLGAVTGVGASL
jgi:hypothetical protein